MRPIFIALTMLILGVLPSEASVIAVTGDTAFVAPPADARLGQFEDDEFARLFLEVESLILPSALTVDITAPGSYFSVPVGTETIAAGTNVDSYYLVTDPVGVRPSTDQLRYTGTMTFSSDVIGIIAFDSLFAASNGIVGHPGTLYSNVGLSVDFGSFGFEGVILSADRRSMFYDLTSGPAADNLRIITAATAVPEPASLLLLGTGIAGLVAKARRRKKGNEQDV